jgi:hypothetical protein
MAYISEEGASGYKTRPDDHPYNGMTCAQWRAVDVKREDPFEFHAKYMACLFDYGRTRGEDKAPWNLEYPKQ